jgi:hypothetical protein
VGKVYLAELGISIDCFHEKWDRFPMCAKEASVSYTQSNCIPHVESLNAGFNAKFQVEMKFYKRKESGNA